MNSLLRRRADGEGVPLEGGYGRDVDEDVVARLEGKVRRPLDHQRHHLRGKDDPRGDPGLALLAHGVAEPVELLNDEEDAGHDEPLPEVGGVKDEQEPVEDVEAVRPPEDLKGGKHGEC